MALQPKPGIIGDPVPALFPESGHVSALLIGEAPGPEGADKSLIPFWGDRAGELRYRTLKAETFAEFPDMVWEHWDGTTLRTLGIKPRLQRVAITNALDRCPTSDGVSFGPPTNAELAASENLLRLRQDVTRATAIRSETKLIVITMGQKARLALARLGQLENVDLHALPHPSSRGLLSSQPGHGKGSKITGLRQDWADDLKRLLLATS